MSDEIEWEDPPDAILNRERRGKYDDFADALRERPQQWAVAPFERTIKGADSLVNSIRHGKMRTFPKGEFEAVCDRHTGKVWVRYIKREA
jgi:hypothetical protein